MKKLMTLKKTLQESKRVNKAIFIAFQLSMLLLLAACTSMNDAA